MNAMFIMYANHKKVFSQKKVPANLEKDARVYFKVKNKLGMRVWWCEIKLNSEREKKLSLPCNSKWKKSFFIF